jgi:ankyrin repeat protein
LLLDAGADVTQPFVDGEHTLSPLYGAAGKNQNAEMTKLLLDAGANPEDGESLYHSMEEHGMECARLLLEAGAKVEGSNALHHCLDQDDIEKLKLLLSYTKDANDSGSGLGSQAQTSEVQSSELPGLPRSPFVCCGPGFSSELYPFFQPWSQTCAPPSA